LKRLGWQRPRAGHWLLIAALMLPLSTICSQLQNEVFKLVPWSHDQMARLMESMSSAPLWLALLIIGVCPALGEELLFRGLIGRGLVARYGVVLGIAITSVFFGLTHLNPAQVIGTIPLGIAMHFVYLTTRSFWAPMTLHLLNNAFAVVLLKFGDDFDVKELTADFSDSMPASLLLASACLVATIGLVLWQTRVRYVTSDGAAWDPGYPTIDVPPPEAGARPVNQPAKPGLVLATAFCALGFAAAVWKMTAGG
jgi:membrane protease YdiL (CAAX protease family)